MAGTKALVFNARRGAVKFGTPEAARPTGLDFIYGTGWVDLGKLKKQPTLTPTSNTDSTNIWQDNEEIELASTTSWELDAESAEINLNNLRFALNAEINENGALVPGDDYWEGQVSVYLTNGKRRDVIHGPAASMSDLGAFDFPSTDITSIPWTVKFNKDDQLGKPFQWFSTEWDGAAEVVTTGEQ